MIFVDILVYRAMGKGFGVITVKNAPNIGVVGKTSSVFETIGQLLGRYVLGEQLHSIKMRAPDG